MTRGPSSFLKYLQRLVVYRDWRTFLSQDFKGPRPPQKLVHSPPQNCLKVVLDFCWKFMSIYAVARNFFYPYSATFHTIQVVVVSARRVVTFLGEVLVSLSRRLRLELKWGYGTSYNVDLRQKYNDSVFS